MTRDEDLVGHLVRTTSLGTGTAGRLLDEFLAYFSESVEEFVARRHRELQAEGLATTRIFARIAERAAGAPLRRAPRSPSARSAA